MGVREETHSSFWCYTIVFEDSWKRTRCKWFWMFWVFETQEIVWYMSDVSIRQFFHNNMDWNACETLEPNRIFTRLKLGNKSLYSYTSRKLRLSNDEKCSFTKISQILSNVSSSQDSLYRLQPKSWMSQPSEQNDDQKTKILHFLIAVIYFITSKRQYYHNVRVNIFRKKKKKPLIHIPVTINQILEKFKPSCKWTKTSSRSNARRYLPASIPKRPSRDIPRHSSFDSRCSPSPGYTR